MRWSRVATVAVLATVLLGGAAHGARSGEAAAPRILVFSKTAGFRHDSIPAGLAAIEALGVANGFEVDDTEDAASFTAPNLAQYEAVVWLSTTGDVLDAAQQATFESFVQAGGGFVGVHAASDTEPGWAWYQGLVGASFAGHPAGTPTATIKVADRVHPSTSALPDRWVRTDEWYDFAANPRGSVHVLATLDETTYAGGTMGFDHPIAWCHGYAGGRAWYTGGGHTSAAFSEPLFRAHLLGGIRWAAGLAAGDCTGTVSGSYQKVALDEDTFNPLELKVAPDGRVLFVELGGKLKIHKPATQTTVVAAQLAVNTTHEDGLLGLALDPGFATNHWLYLFYARAGSASCAPSDPDATLCGRNVLSRFTLVGDALDPGSEIVLLEIPTQRDQCCHAAGSLDFGANGDLFLSTGDNTNPFASDGYTPIDERDGRSSWDAQRTSANTNDLRGKLLRIHPEPDGTYTVPAGNLFAPGTALTRPEIYAMGFRNPFRFDADPQTGLVFVADYGPDAGSGAPNRGPKGQVEWNLIEAPGNYGWPYCVANGQAYVDYDFATGASGAAFDCSAPTNGSPSNTGLTSLPPAVAATVWHGYDSSAEFPELGTGCGCPMAGPMYHFDAALVSARKFPEYFDGTPFFYSWGRRHVKEFRLDEEGDLLKINPFLPNVAFAQPIDLEFGPDGALYLIEWGSAFTNNTDSGVYRIDHLAGGAPTSVAVAWLRAERTAPGRTTVRWRVARGHRPLGFNVWRSRRPDGAWRKLNRRLVAGGAYSWVDRASVRRARSWYRLELVAPSGRSTWAGPVGVSPRS